MLPIIINEILEKKQQYESITQKEKSNIIPNYWEDTPKKLIHFWKNVSSSNIINARDPWIYLIFIDHL